MELVRFVVPTTNRRREREWRHCLGAMGIENSLANGDRESWGDVARFVPLVIASAGYAARRATDLPSVVSRSGCSYL